MDIENVRCVNCGKEHEYDRLMGWGCIVVLDQTQIPHEVIEAYCDTICLGEYFKQLFEEKTN